MSSILPKIEVDEEGQLYPDKPFLWFERISDNLRLKKWYLYPIPLIVLYFVTAFVPHLYSMNSDVWWKIHYLNFSDTLGWLVLIITVSYGTAYFRTELVRNINRLFDDGIINPDFKNVNEQEDIAKKYKKIRDSARDPKIFFGFLILFELLVGFFWYFDIQEGEIVLSQSEFVLQIPGTIIMIFVLPTAAEIFTIAVAGALLPYQLDKYIKVKPLHLDHHGGLKPFGNIMLVMEYVYVGGLAISFIAFEEFRSTPILFGLFIVIMSALILIPQISLSRKLTREKNASIAEIQAVYLYKSKPDSKENKISPESERSNDSKPDSKERIKILPEWEKSNKSFPFDASYLTFVKMAKDEVELMRVWSFDLVTLYKAITLSVLPVMGLILPFVQTSVIP